MTADCDSYREQLAATHPNLGHAIWEPTSVDVGDVGCIQDGKFLRLFNALHPEGHPSNLRFGVPEFHDPLVPRVPNHIDKGILKHSHYCSSRIIVTSEPEFMAQGPDGPEKLTFLNGSRRGGAVLYLPVDASRWDTLARRDFGQWMIKHIDCWLAFARQLGLGIEQMEDIVLVTGCHRTISWANAVFLEGHTDAQASFKVEVVRDPAITVKWQFFPSRTRGAVCSWSPEGKNLPEDQCIFVRGFRVVRRLGILPRQLRGAARPNPSRDRDHDDYDEQHVELVSLPNTAVSRDPLHVLSEYIINKSPDCDMTLVHDDDLARIDKTWDNELGAFHPDAMMHYLQMSEPEIVQLVVDGQLSTNENCAEVGTKAYTVAMSSKEFQEWNRLTAHSTWRIDVLSTMYLAIIMSLVWASRFQFFIIVLSFFNLNWTSSQVLHDPLVLITAMCCATTRFTIAAQDREPDLLEAWISNPLTMLKDDVRQRRYRRMFPITFAAILGSTVHVLFLVEFNGVDEKSELSLPIVCIFFGNAFASIAASLSHILQELSSHGVEAERIPDATNTDAYHEPGLRPTIIQLSILIAISFLGIVMDKASGDVGQAMRHPMIIMFMTAATALMCIIAESVPWSFFDSGDDIRYERINTHPNTLRRSYSGPVQAIARVIRRPGFRHNKDKTERSLQDEIERSLQELKSSLQEVERSLQEVDRAWQEINRP